MNFLKGSIESAGNRLVFVEKSSAAAPVRIELNDSLSRRAQGHVGKAIVFGIRPEDVHDALTVSAPHPGRIATVTVEVSEPMGAETFLYLDTGAHSFIARVRGSEKFDLGHRVKVSFDVEKAHLFDPQTEAVLT
jgi:multiple sugar transport system ATP-binding protein